MGRVNDLPTRSGFEGALLSSPLFSTLVFPLLLYLRPSLPRLLSLSLSPFIHWLHIFLLNSTVLADQEYTFLDDRSSPTTTNEHPFSTSLILYDLFVALSFRSTFTLTLTTYTSHTIH